MRHGGWSVEGDRGEILYYEIFRMYMNRFCVYSKWSVNKFRSPWTKSKVSVQYEV